MKRGILFVMLFCASGYAGVSIIPLDSTQTNIREAYRYAFWRSKDLWVKLGDVDTGLANQFGELPILISGHYNGFVYPDTLSPSRPFTTLYSSSFNPSTLGNSWSLRWMGNPGIAVYKSSIVDPYEQTVSWELPYFEEFFRNILGFGWGSEVVEIVDSMLPTISPNVRLLIIPAFESGDSSSEYIHATVEFFPTLGDALRNFLARGGTIYTEGNAAYLLEAYGIIPPGSVNLSDVIDGISDSMNARVQVTDAINPLGMVSINELYTVSAPTFARTLPSVVRYTATGDPRDNGKPAIIYLEGDPALGGRIILCAGLPAVESLTHPNQRGWQWLANAVLLAFCERVSVARSIFTNVLVPSEIAPMALPADAEQIFNITVRVRNLWGSPMRNVTVEENFKSYFDYVDTPEGPEPVVEGTRLTFTIPTINAHSEYRIVYRLKTPPLSDARTSNINSYLDYDVYMRPSTNYTSFDDPVTSTRRGNGRWSLWCYFLFNARIVADTDLNWKNILGNFYQPFKIFMIMENKERTSALETKYVQYVPLDIPVLWVDPSARTPIVTTPGGAFVDLLRGSEDRNMNGRLDAGELEYDMNGDGNPDAWLDIKSFHPAPDSITLEQIYWLNPWNDMYEDIDRDGVRPTDINGDGIFEIEDPDDKIRAYRVVWNFGTIPGYQWYDPKCSWEIWLDPPDLVKMAIGAPDTLGYDGPDSGGFYYSGWQRWMNHDASGRPIFRRLIYQTAGSYTGYIFADSSYALRRGDVEMGWVPYPREEYICVLNLGGKDPTMTSPTPDSSLYANIYYKTVWGQEKICPIRTSYTYYTPLPNPLQFEYISTTYEARDPSSGRLLTYLPGNGDADLTFHITASTEYSLYWIKLASRDVDGDGVGDGVFGYIIHNIPKGFGGYSIELPRNPDGSFNIAAIVPDYHPVDLLDTTLRREVEVWEYPFYWSIYIPQVLIPAALDDDNRDGIDDWLDDYGDRFESETGYLHDVFPPGSGEEAESLYGVGWWMGEDGAIGDDDIEKLGSVSFTVKARFKGRGREGEVKINDGTWLVCEEIFGGSPWVIWSHTQSGYAIANNINISRAAEPSLVSLHPDTTMIKFAIWDAGEPHTFDEFFDPWLVSFGQGQTAFTTHAGGKDPCSLLQPDYLSHARIDPLYDTMTVTAIPWATGDSILENAGYPKTATGAFLQVIIEVNNNTDEHWYDVTVTPSIFSLGSTEEFLWYAVYPRPLVPGDDPRTFRMGWRFNPSAREVLMRIGNPDGSATIPEILASRRAYYIFTFKIDPLLPQGVYDIPFQISGRARRYDETSDHHIWGVAVPSAKFAIVRRNPDGVVVSNPRFVIGTAHLSQFRDVLRADLAHLLGPDFRWSSTEPHLADFGSYSPIPFTYTDSTITANLPYSTFPPDPDHTSFWLCGLVETRPKMPGVGVPLDYGASISYSDYQDIPRETGTGAAGVNVRGSFLVSAKQVLSVNGVPVGRDGYYILEQNENRMKIGLILRNRGNDIATTPSLSAKIAPGITLLQADTLYPFSFDTATNTLTFPRVSDILPGERRVSWVELGVPNPEGRTALDIMYTFTADYNPEHYKTFDYDTIRYALDLMLRNEDLSVSDWNPNRGEEITITAKVHHTGIAEAKNVHLRAWYEDLTGELRQIGSDIVIPRLNVFDSVYTGSFIFRTATEENVYFQRIFVMIDPDSAFGESNEHNNIGVAEVWYGKGNPLHNVVNYPNPFRDRTDFTYVLSYPVHEVKIKVYTLSGRFIKEFRYAPASAGYNYVSWDGRDEDGDEIANGTYIYRVIARFGNKTYEVRERAVKMK